MMPLSFCNEGEHTPVMLFIGAHSDDIEIGCGGSIIKMAEEGVNARIHWVVFSAPGSREVEARQSANELLTTFHSFSIEIFDFRDGYFPQDAGELKDRFERLKASLSPDLIFTHHGGDLHQDHRIISELTWNTFRNHLILEYEIPKYDGGLGSPNSFVALTESVVTRKCEHLDRHFASQRDHHWFTADLFLGLMRLRGMECRSKSRFAEAFYCRKAVINWNRS